MGDLSRANSGTLRNTPTFQRPISRPASSKVFGGGGGGPRPGGAAVRHRPVQYDYATGSTFSVKINGKPMFLLGDFRKKVDKNVKGARYVSAFRKALEQQKTEKDKQDAIRDQYDKVIVDRFFPVEHTDTGLTKRMLGLNPANPDEVPPEQGQVGVSRIDRIDPMDNAASGMEKYQPCRSSVFPPAQFHGLDDTDPQWQREPSSHLALDFAYGYQGSSCWDQDLFGIGPGLNNLNFVYYFDPSKNVMRASSEIVYHTAAACVVNALDTNMQRFFYHSDDVTAMALLVRRHQGPDGMWVETNKPLGSKEKSDWTKWFAYSKGIHTPDRTWSPTHRTLPVSTEEWPCLKDGAEYDWRTWDLPNRCIVASGQKGRNPTIYVWRIVCPRGEHVLTNQLLAKMNIGAKRREVAALSFNSQGTLLVTLCQDFEQHIQVYDWRVGTMIREGPGGAKIECLMFNPFSASAFASCGEKHLKFWELGDADLEMAAGLFGDLGEAINIYSITFHPRGLTISGTISGDIYVWSNGTVTAKIAGAHKGKVLGLLYVPDVALFSSGEGGEIKMWDPNLSDTKRPLGIVDLRSLCGRKGDFQLLQKLCGRSLDWSTDETMLECLCDDNPVLDLPAQNVCGAPATHLSFRDLGVRRETGGVLLIGTTCNSILALGIRRVEDGSWAKDGLSGATPLNGDSKNSKEDSLERQDFWAKVEQYKGKNGAKAGHLPVAVYKYQTNNPSAPGYRGPNQMGCPWQLACCGKKILVNGHFGEARCVVPMPNERIFVSGSQDRTVRLWDINDQTMIDCFESPYPISCAKWWSKHTADGTVGEEEVVKGKSNPVLTVGHSNGSFSIWRFEVAANEAAAQDDAGDKNPFYDPEDAFGECTLCCVNPLPRRSPGAGICSLNYSDDGKYLGVGTGDNCVDIYRHNLVLLEYKPFGDVAREQARQKTLGLSDAEIARQDCFPYKRIGCMNDHSANVLGIDFATDGTVFRSVSASNELLFGSLPSGKFNTATQECSQKKYGTHTCKFGWTVKSIWAKGSTADDINSIDVSKNKVPPWAPCFGGTHPAPYPLPFNFTPNGSVDPVDKHRVKNFPGEGSPTTWGHQVCVTAQDDGKVKLFRWPAFGFKQHFRSYIGHGSQCTDVRFTHDDDYILSAGGADMSIFQWRHVIPNKIYVQNLPDATGPDGKYKIGYWDLYRLLEDFFSKMLKADTEHVRSARLENAEVKKAVDKAKSEGMSAEVEPLLKYRVAKVVASRMDACKERGPPPDRGIVSIQIFSSGAADKTKFYPSKALGSQISGRWATVVFTTVEEARDVLDLYGGGAELALHYDALWKAGSLPLWPLYRMTCDEEGLPEDPGSTESAAWADPPAEAPATYVSSSLVGGKETRYKWTPLGPEDYATAGNVPFLRVTAADPNEQAAVFNIDDVLATAGKDDLSSEAIRDMTFADVERKVEMVASSEIDMLKMLKEWLRSDEDFGLTSSEAGNDEHFPHFHRWLKAGKAGDGGGAVGK